jgi:hypothetical protein
MWVFMPVTRKPLRQGGGEASLTIDEAKVREVINRGGSVAKKEASEDDIMRVQLRLHPSLVEEIDLARKNIKRGKKPSRHVWIVAAIEEKLAREGERPDTAQDAEGGQSSTVNS